MKKIIKKSYYKILFKLISPLAVGSGENAETDRDVIKDAAGVPYIPASAIAGVTRGWLADSDKTEEKYFGNVKPATKEEKKTEAMESVLVFYDARIEKKESDMDLSYHIAVRDSVRLDSYKTAIKGNKFDMEVLEPGYTFVTYLEQNFYDDKDIDYAYRAAELFLKNQLQFGGKVTRGYGEISDAKVQKKCFNLTDQEDVKRWLSFDLYDKDQWSSADVVRADREEQSQLRITLYQRGGISIRKYATRPRAGTDDISPDFSQLTVHRNVYVDNEQERIPVIPGTTWAGVFCHRMCELGLDQEEKDSLFGYVKQGLVSVEKRAKRYTDKKKSDITFSETQLEGANARVMSRIALDRFTGGTKDHALFTEESYYDGIGDLVIRLNNGRKLSVRECKILSAALSDLHMGFLSVGGETSIGRGIFEIKKINGEEIPKEVLSDRRGSGQVYQWICSKVEEAFQ